MTTTDQPEPTPATNIGASLPGGEARIGSSPNDSTAAAMEQRLFTAQRRFNQGSWILGSFLIFIGVGDDRGDRMTWREASGKPPRQRRRARRRNPAD